jgi:hypothetical protein
LTSLFTDIYRAIIYSYIFLKNLSSTNYHNNLKRTYCTKHLSYSYLIFKCMSDADVPTDFSTYVLVQLSYLHCVLKLNNFLRLMEGSENLKIMEFSTWILSCIVSIHDNIFRKKIGLSARKTFSFKSWKGETLYNHIL